jgi:LL-diaminopimelate aminotransferase
MATAIRDPANHRYSLGAGAAAFRQCAAEFMQKRYGLTLDPNAHVLALIGSKEGIGHLPLAVVNPGERVLVPQPGYPVYAAASLLAGGVPCEMPLLADRGWRPDFDAVPKEVADGTKLMFLNYPNNPTGAVADLDFFGSAVAFARRHDILIAHDAAYGDVYFDQPPPSMLQVEGAIDNVIEFHSLSKTFNMTGWRIAFAVGNPDALAALGKIKDNVDSGPFCAIQQAAIEALNNTDHPSVRKTIYAYRLRRDLVVGALTDMGLRAETPQAGFYIWAGCPNGYTSMEFAAKLLDAAAVVVIPGSGFGAAGEGYFRIALTVDLDRTQEAMDRLRSVKW